MAGGESGWLSAHLHFGGSIYAPECDAVILDCIFPFLADLEGRGVVERHFYIRYAVEGPHVRLRMFGNVVDLQETVAPALVEYAAGATDPREGRASVRWVPYEPEVDRYGGPHALGVAESFFWRSSVGCADLLRAARPMTHTDRLGKALLGMTVLTGTFAGRRETAAELASAYSLGYLQTLTRSGGESSALVDRFLDEYDRQADHLNAYVEEAWRRLEEDEGLPPGLEELRSAARDVRDAATALADRGAILKDGQDPADWRWYLYHVVPSLLHMTNNRLGVPIKDESYLAMLLHRVLAGVGDPPRHRGRA